MSSPIAIVGVSVELPSGGYSTENLDHKTFFDFLLSSGEAYEEIPSDRFNVEAWKGPGAGKIHVNKGAFLKDIDTFDNVEFGISSKDASTMAPATRKLLENAFLALLDSGSDYRMKNVGCFTSGTSIEMGNVSEPDEFEARGSFAGYPSMIANRLSNHLDLIGPSVPMDTACSSTLTAMHIAVQAISNGDCEAAVVGGCQLNHRFIDWITYSQGSLLAKDGKCKPFDSTADGFSRAEGCAVVVIKPLADAIRDQDHIYATILGTAINSTGSAAPPGAPVAESQRDAMVQAFQRAGRSPREVDYVELHATGTAKGDPTEANWVGEHFHREDELVVGSVKGNIGHTEIVAFLASLSKVISIFDKGVIPPQVNIRHLNPGIKWDEYRLRVPLECTPLSVRSSDKSLVSIAGSGIGGSNGHVVLESPPRRTPVVNGASVGLNSRGPLLIMTGGLSARAATSISESIESSFGNYVSDLPGLSTVLGRRSKQATYRSFAIAGVNETTIGGFSSPEHCPRIINSLIYVFSGQGPQHKDMGRELFEKFPVFRQSIVEMDDVFRRVTGQSIISDYGLFDESSGRALPEIWPIALVLPSVAIFQIALFDLLVSLGMKPDAIVGHSAGETAVLYASGAASKAMAVELAIIRGQSFTAIEKLGGTMAAVSCTPEVMDEILVQYRKEHEDALVELACFNSPSAVAIAGEEVAVDAIVALADGRGFFARKIRTKVPFHSSMMEKAKAEYTAALDDLFRRYPGPHVPKVATYSTLTGELYEGSFDADYFWSNTRSPVRFTQTMEVIRAAHPSSTFVEFAPHPVLSSYVVSMASETSTVLHSVLRPKRGGRSTEHLDILRLCGKVTVAGHNCVDFVALNGRTCSDFKLALPTYPFVKKRYPLYPDTPGVQKQMEAARGPLNHAYLRMNKDSHPTLAEHIIRGEPIMPAAGFLEMAFEFGASTLMNVNLRSILSLSSEKPVKVDIQLDGAYWTVKSIPSTKSRKDASSNTGRLHADGYLSFETPHAVSALDIEAVRNRCPGHIGSGFYPSLSYFSAYGTHFQRVTNMYYSVNEALASIKGTDAFLASDGKYILHPAILDACIQMTAYKPFHGDYDPNVYYLPAHVDAIIAHQPLKVNYFPAHIYAHIELKQWKPDGMVYDICLVDDSGVRLCTFAGLEVAKHHITPVTDAARPLQVAFQPAFQSERPKPTTTCTAVDHSDLYATLDKMSIRMKMSAKTGQITKPSPPTFGQTKELAPYLELLAADKACSSTKVSSSEGPQFEQAIIYSMTSLRDALKHISVSGTKVVEVLIASNVKSDFFRVSIEEVFREFSTLHVNLFVDNKHPAQTLPTVASGMVRNVSVKVGDNSSAVEDQLFDVALFFNVADDKAKPQHIVDTANRLLLPGGTFIVAERNLEAWESMALGTVWYNAAFGSPSSENTYRLSSYLESLAKFTVQRVHNSEDADPFHFCIDAQKKTWSNLESPDEALVDPIDSFVYEYSFGNELDLQWELSGLNSTQYIDIWITATEGRDGSAAQGFVRALRREYVSWTIRLVVFPESYDEDMRQEFLDHLPTELRLEQDILVSPEDQNMLMVPRIAPVAEVNASTATKLHGLPTSLPPYHVLLRPISFSKQGAVTGLLATVVDAQSTTLHDETMVVDVACLASFLRNSLELQIQFPLSFLVSSLLSCSGLSAIQSFGPSEARPHPRHSCRHCDRVQRGKVYAKNGLQVMKVDNDASLHDIAKLNGEPFDLIVSGYTDLPYVQVLKTLLEPRRGKLFSWNDADSGLPSILHRDPYSIADALRCSFSMIGGDLESFRLPVTCKLPSEAEMSKSSVLNIGVHLALYMYQRGARHIVLTSRSGRKSLDSTSNVVVRRMIKYLEAKDDLRLSLVAVDATDVASTTALLNTLGTTQVGGCIFLTAVLSDGIFRHLTESDFSRVFSAKLDAFAVTKEVFDFQSMDFVVSFTSVSGLFGFGGQTNYGAANTALEALTSELPNGFSFVCPGVLDSTLVLAGTGEANESRLGSLIPWAVPAEDMIKWFEDSMFRFQKGQRTVRYVCDLNWEVMDRTLGMPRLGKHLLPNQALETASDLDDAAHMSRIVRNVLDIPEADFSLDVPLTAYGIDSLSASRISFLLRPYVQATQIQLLADVSLADLLRSSEGESSAPSESQPVSKPVSTPKKKVEFMSDMLSKYSADMNVDSAETCASSSMSQADKDIILVTGTTGTLGSNILSQLLQNDDVELVYALNRPSKAGTSTLQRQKDIFATQGLPLSLLDSSKLVLLEGDLRVDNFNLPPDVANKACCICYSSFSPLSPASSTMVRIIFWNIPYMVAHFVSAWKVDFATSLVDYEDLIRAVSRLAVRPSLSYISTIGVFQHPKEYSSEEYAPEAPIVDPKISIQTGYIESKWVAERLFQLASENYGLKTNVVRVGLLSGGSNGCWDPSQWFPAIAQSASYLGCLPDGEDLISWIPVDLAAAAIVDMRRAENQTLHLVHPKPVKWNTVMKALATSLGVPLVPYVEWFARLESSSNDADEKTSGRQTEHSRAALRMTHFYRIALSASSHQTESMGLLAKVVTDNALNASPSLRSEDVQPLGEHDVKNGLLIGKRSGFCQHKGHHASTSIVLYFLLLPSLTSISL
ncbi:hypothetical protein CPB84DRAFT_1748061 [Gymnopilus junonius]|uniref:Polyketide synthase n=1 Tax=Gymnopilus junonius TaxID=109634 RepID=A0A9P5TMM2_GYMJU|nr:hypothetical protein CPB84DRAFT_1748061 [Gymnopilus junonius]